MFVLIITAAATSRNTTGLRHAQSILILHLRWLRYKYLKKKFFTPVSRRQFSAHVALYGLPRLYNFTHDNR